MVAIILISCGLFLTVDVYGQITGSISGKVTDKSTGEPLINATVFIEGSSIGTVTNRSGYYTIPQAPLGIISVRFSYLGYLSVNRDIRIQSGKNEVLNIQLFPSDLTSDEVLVEADRSVEFERQISTISLQGAKLKNLPSIGEPDLMRTLQLLPGVQAVNEINAGLYIRGGSPDQNLILLDGITVYNPSHLFGFFSTFNSDAIKDIRLIKGGFPAEYGGRLSAVLDVTNKDGNRNQFQSSGSISLISSKILVEGPANDFTYMISGRRTYLDLFAKAAGFTDLPTYYFYDFNAKVTYDGWENDKITISSYLGNDVLAFVNKPESGAEQAIDLEWGNKTISAKWTHIFSNSIYGNLLIAGTEFGSKTQAELTNGFEVSFNNGIKEGTIKGDLEWTPTNTHFIKFGGQYSQFTFNYNNVIGNTGFSNDIIKTPWYGAFYLQDEWKPDAFWTVISGLRWNYFSSGDRITVEPRVQVRYGINEFWALSASAGHYVQYTTVSVNDVASFADLWFPIDETIPLQTAQQYILGIDYTPNPEYSLSIETYYKPQQGLTEFKRQNELNQNRLIDLFYIGEGISKGFEVFFQKKRNKLTGWVGYTWSETERQFPDINYGKSYPAKWDFTHNLTITGNYDFGNSWTAGSSFIFTSGTTYTVPTGYYLLGPPGGRRRYLRAGEKNANRLEPYHRLDVSVTKSWEAMGGNWRLSFNIFNVYNHRNVWYRDYDFNETGAAPVITDIRLIPILPTVEISFRF